MNHVERAIAIAGGITPLAESLNTSPQVINNWRKRGCPPARCRDIESATAGQVTREQLRPDVFGKAA